MPQSQTAIFVMTGMTQVRSLCKWCDNMVQWATEIIGIGSVGLSRDKTDGMYDVLYNIDVRV